MKKIVFTLLMLVFLLTLVGCGHEHEYTSEVTSPTCTEGGYTTHTCECGDTYTDSEVPATGHSFSEWEVVEEATEEKEGLKEKECTVCGHKEEEKIPMLEHTHKYTDTVVEPTCTTGGYTEHTCRCGHSYKDNEVDELGHSFGEWVTIKESTMIEEGLAERECSVCSFKEQKNLDVIVIPNVYAIVLEANQDKAIWPTRPATSREEIIEQLYADLYEWAQSNGETKTFEQYVEALKADLAGYKDIKLRNTELGNYATEDGSTEYFLNIPKYFYKWSGFFAVFNEAMLKVNPQQSFYKDTYAAMVRVNQFITWTSTAQRYFSSFVTQMCAGLKIAEIVPTTYTFGEEYVLPTLSVDKDIDFLGWYDNPEFTGDPVTKISSTDTGHKFFYAKWEEEIFVEKVDMNTINELLLSKTHQLEWTLTPNNVTDDSIEFFSSNLDVATITPKGLITAISKGTTTITVKVYGNRELDFTFEVEVYTDDYIDAAYETSSYVVKGNEIKLLAEIVRRDKTTAKVTWESLTPEIATVDSEGKVKAISSGLAKIVAKDPTNENLKLEFVVVVLDVLPTGILDLALRSHESNIFRRYDLNIGWEYTKDILGSVSDLFAGSPLVKNTSYYEQSNKTTATYGTMKSIEFITVHYTGNMASGATAAANASYFAGSKDVSIHYTTGNDGVFYCLDESQAAWHAGDSGALSRVGEFKWNATGVKVKDGDPQYPSFTISDDFYYEINGQKTKIKMPTPWNYNDRNTDHILNSNGTISSKSGYGQTAFSNRAPEEFMNDQSLPFMIKNGEYYMGTTWWCYTQIYEGRICSTGGNRNSIGIESCVNKGTDLWWTWQKTAQLVADIMLRNELDITRVRGHHFFSAKNCPQPMLENDLEIWYKFIDLVEAEYELLTTYEGYEVSITSNYPDIVNNNGRVVKQPDQTTCVTYTIKFTKGTDVQEITLASLVDGYYVDR